MGGTVEKAAEVAVQDVIGYVKQHPAYGQIVQALAEQALKALAAEAGVGGL